MHFYVHAEVRQIPLEVGLRGRTETLYGETVDEARLVGKEVKIPFQAPFPGDLWRFTPPLRRFGTEIDVDFDPETMDVHLFKSFKLWHQ